MTQEEKAKAYDEALSRAKNLHKDAIDMGENIRAKQCEIIFPELKEIEDENIRKELTEFLKSASEGRLDILTPYKTFGKWLAWLEKQGEKTQGKSALEAINEEKVDNQNCVKPTDKPKFHEGDWCIDKEDGTIFFIKRVLGNTYKYITNAGREYSCTHYSLENDARLWTISDAKDGDVLQLGGVTAIFKEYIGNGNCKCYCSVFDGEFEIPSQDGDDNSYGCIDATPATKEQRDKLEKAMAEADYEFDFEKKELKKAYL